MRRRWEVTNEDRLQTLVYLRPQPVSLVDHFRPSRDEPPSDLHLLSRSRQTGLSLRGDYLTIEMYLVLNLTQIRLRSIGFAYYRTILQYVTSSEHVTRK